FSCQAEDCIRDFHVTGVQTCALPILGIWQLKWELEDLAFRQLEPETYHRIAGLLDDKRRGRERYIEQVRQQLAEAMDAQGIRARSEERRVGKEGRPSWWPA